MYHDADDEIVLLKPETPTWLTWLTVAFIGLIAGIMVLKAYHEVPRTPQGPPVAIQALLDAVDAARASAGLQGLQDHPLARCEAQIHAENINDDAPADLHEGFADRAAILGYGPGSDVKVGESIVISGDPQEVVDTIMRETWPGTHRQILLDRAYDSLGVGKAERSDGQTTWVLLFVGRFSQQ